MRRLALVILIVIGVLTSTTAAHADWKGRWHGPCDGWAMAETLTPRLYLADPARAMRRLQRLARCVFDWRRPGTYMPAVFATISRESGWWPWAKNPDQASACRPWDQIPYGSCGLAQHLARYWVGRVHDYISPEWFPHTWPEVSPLDARANLIAMAGMWDGGGCPGPWCSSARSHRAGRGIG